MESWSVCGLESELESKLVLPLECWSVCGLGYASVYLLAYVLVCGLELLLVFVSEFESALQ